MLYFKHLKPHCNKGNLNLAVILSVLVGVVSGGLSYALLAEIRSKNNQIQSSRQRVQETSALETISFAVGIAEMKYLTVARAQGCAVIKPFYVALAEGSGCPGPAIRIFRPQDKNLSLDFENPNDPNGPPITVNDTIIYKTGPGAPFSYPNANGCSITATGSTCILDPAMHFLNVVLTGIGAPQVTSYSYRVFLRSADPVKNRLTIEAEETFGSKSRRLYASIKPSFDNAAHLEVDGRVTQETPDPLSFCAGNAWGNYLLLNNVTKQCVEYVQLGSGTGLGLYRGRYFGLRPADGQLIDLAMITIDSSAGYLIDENGKVSGKGNYQYFPKYVREAFVNVSDVTVIGDNYFTVEGQGDDAKITLLIPGNPPAYDKRTVCPIGKMGWGQSYEGILAHSDSDPFVHVTNGNEDQLRLRFATMELKTTTGDHLTVLAAAMDDGSGNHLYGCSVTKDLTKQRIEYSRTNGWESAGVTPPYIQIQ